MTDANTPPGPDDPGEKDYAERALAEADRALHLAQTRQPGAQLAFLRSWQAVLSGYAADVQESRYRSLAWERAEEAEARLEEIREIVNDDRDFQVARVREVLGR